MWHELGLQADEAQLLAGCLCLSALSVCGMCLAYGRKRPSCLLNSSTCLSSCLSACLSSCLSVFVSICLSVLSICWYVLVLQEEEAQQHSALSVCPSVLFTYTWYVLGLQEEEVYLLAQQHSAVSICLVYIHVVCAWLTGGRGLFAGRAAAITCLPQCLSDSPSVLSVYVVCLSGLYMVCDMCSAYRRKNSMSVWSICVCLVYMWYVCLVYK